MKARWIIAILVMLVVSVCSGIETRTPSVSSVIVNSKKYYNRDTAVSGSLMFSSDQLAICDPSPSDSCIDLEMRVDIYEKAKKLDKTSVIIEGRYVGHEFRREGDGFTFLPSRIIVTDIRENRD